MSDYFEQHDEPQPAPSSFVRPLNLDRRSSRHTSRHSNGSGLTYVTNLSVPAASENNAPEPIFGMPTPIIPNAPPLSESASRSEYMMVDPDPEYQPEEESGVQMQGGRRGFVGGFVAGLKNLPRVMLRHPRVAEVASEKKGHYRRRTVDDGGPGLPMYQSYMQDPPVDPSNVEIVAGMPMPTPHTISVTSPSLRENPDDDQASYSDMHPSRPNTQAGDTTLIHQSQINIGSPVQADMQPASDYDKMSSIAQSAPSVSIAAHINRLQQFFQDINDLPWVSSRVAVDYIPERNGRRGTGKRQTPKASESWYPAHQELDLLSNGSPDMGGSVAMTHRREGSHRRALTDSSLSPTSTGMSRSLASPSIGMSPRYSVTSEPGPGGRNHRHVRTPRHHQRRPLQRQPTSPPQPTVYPYIATPQPMYIYSGPPSPPQLMSPGGSPVGQGQSVAATSPGMPVYMIPMPPPVYQQMPGYPYPVGKQASPPSQRTP